MMAKLSKLFKLCSVQPSNFPPHNHKDRFERHNYTIFVGRLVQPPEDVTTSYLLTHQLDSNKPQHKRRNNVEEQQVKMLLPTLYFMGHVWFG